MNEPQENPTSQEISTAAPEPKAQARSTTTNMIRRFEITPLSYPGYHPQAILAGNIIERIELNHKLAFKIKDAAEAIGVCRKTMSRLIAQRKIYPTKELRLIAKEELLRYLREEVEAAKRRKRFPTVNRCAAA
jgi:hypothetical protein